ncbi:MAG: hypothetical protein LBD33_00795 [Puniceicoccales bacterium]|jgi:hypothetical protein|nr:hypothetical protein [Puniceicoccales bacterium]
MKIFLKFIRIMRIRYKLGVFAASLLISMFFLIYCAIHSYRQSQLTALCDALALEQEVWFRHREEIFQKFSDACGKLKSKSPLGNFLMAFVEKTASDCDCNYELLSEHSHKTEGISIASVSAALRNVTLAKFVHFSNAVTADGARISKASFVSNRDGGLDVKCLIEAVSLDVK